MRIFFCILSHMELDGRLEGGRHDGARAWHEGRFRLTSRHAARVHCTRSREVKQNNYSNCTTLSFYLCKEKLPSSYFVPCILASFLPRWCLCAQGGISLITGYYDISTTERRGLWVRRDNVWLEWCLPAWRKRTTLFLREYYLGTL